MAPRDMTVVLIEDDRGVRAALNRVLRIAGFRVESFASAEQCVESDRVACADCLVCDVELPGDSGFEFYEKLTAAGTTLPAIFITAYDSAAVHGAARRLNAAAYLVKPFDIDALIDAICKTKRPA